MPKLVLGVTPKTFKPFPVKFILPDGEEDQLQVTFKYKTRDEFAEFLNTLFVDADAEPTEQQTAESKHLDFVDMYKRGDKKAVKHLSEIIVAWDLSDEITADAMAALHNQAPAAAAALTAAYSAACSEGRLGN